MPQSNANCLILNLSLTFVVEPERPKHAPRADVVERVLEQAQQPRTDHQDAHLDELMATVVDRSGTEPVDPSSTVSSLTVSLLKREAVSGVCGAV